MVGIRGIGISDLLLYAVGVEGFDYGMTDGIKASDGRLGMVSMGFVESASGGIVG